MEVRLSPAGTRVTAFWLVLVGLAAGGILFWMHRLTGLIVWGLWALGCLYYLLFYAPSVVIRADSRELTIRAGVILPTLRRIPLRSLCGITRYSSPLLRAVHCSALLLYTGSGLICFLCGLRLNDAKAIADLLQEG